MLTPFVKPHGMANTKYMSVKLAQSGQDLAQSVKLWVHQINREIVIDVINIFGVNL